MKRSRRFPNRPESVPAARYFVKDALTTAPQPVVSAVELMVSELVTNCVRHADTGFELSICRTPEQIRVEVTDGGSRQPKMRFPKASDVSGRGLPLVDMMSERWGIDPRLRHPGKTVWFTVPTQAA